MPLTQVAANPQRITAVGLLFCVNKENRVTHLELLGSLFSQVNNSFFADLAFLAYCAAPPPEWVI